MSPSSIEMMCFLIFPCAQLGTDIQTEEMRLFTRNNLGMTGQEFLKPCRTAARTTHKKNHVFTCVGSQVSTHDEYGQLLGKSKTPQRIYRNKKPLALIFKKLRAFDQEADRSSGAYKNPGYRSCTVPVLRATAKIVSPRSLAFNRPRVQMFPTLSKAFSARFQICPNCSS